jgi:hypothetical protein
LLTDRDEISNLHRGHSIDASCHVLVNLAKWFQRRRFKKIGQSETRIACGGPCLLTDQDEMSTLHRGHSIDVSCHVSVIWSSGFRGGDLKKLANQKQELPVESHVW